MKYFFVKDLNEYVSAPEDLLSDDEFMNHNEDLKAAVRYALYGNDKFAREVIYKNLVQWNQNKVLKDLKQFYEGNLFCETEIEGLKIDFNFGLRLDIPRGNFHARISDAETKQIFFDEDISDARLISSENYFIRWQVEVFQDGEKIFEHILDLKNQNVLIVSLGSALGDNLASLPYVREFQKIHGCKIFLHLPKYLKQIVKNLYPEFQQVENISYNYYATYYLLSSMGAMQKLPADSRTISVEKVGGINLGLENLIPALPKFTPTKKRKIKNPYVCISVQASMTTKTWLYPNGWEIVCDYLKNLGYRVLCIDKNKIENDNGYKVQKPKGAEDFTGNISLIDRANMLYYADFFIGLSSGLAWLAHSVNCPVIMISGFTQDYNEFFTPYRVANRFVCNGCYNDVESPLFLNNICPKYFGTERELECQKKISPNQVIQAVEEIIKFRN